MKNKTLVFTATYNEAENIEKFLSSTLIIENIDVLIIDDNSPDGTANIIESFKEKYKNLFFIKRHGKLGLDTAHKEGFNYARSRNYQNLITMDADLSHSPSEISIFIEKLETSPFVIGSRYILGGKNEMKLFRFLMSFLGNSLIKLVFNIKCSEYTTSFRGFNFNLLKNFDINNVKSKGYSFFMETVYQINKSGNSIKEIPIIFKDRKKGISKIPKIETLRTLKNLFLLKIYG
jgi:dolichol-phosphate mannosyltransferase